VGIEKLTRRKIAEKLKGEFEEVIVRQCGSLISIGDIAR